MRSSAVLPVGYLSGYRPFAPIRKLALTNCCLQFHKRRQYVIRSRRSPARFNLWVHLLSTSVNRVNLLLQTRDGRFLLLDSSMCFEELVEQHRVHSLVADGISGRSSQKV